MDSVASRLDELTAALESARALPLSASCVVNRSELLALVADLRALLPAEMTAARSVLEDKDGVLAEGRRQAARLVEQAHEERRQLLADSEVLVAAQVEAERLLTETDATVRGMRTEVDEYVDGKLANFEIVLAKTLKAVERGRAKLAGRDELAEIVERRDEATVPR